MWLNTRVKNIGQKHVAKFVRKKKTVLDSLFQLTVEIKVRINLKNTCKQSS